MKVLRWPRSLGLRLFLVLAVFAAAPTILMVSLSDFALRATINGEIGKAALGRLRVAWGIESILGDLARNTCMRVAVDPELQALGRFAHYRHIVSDGDTQYQFAQYLDRLDDSVRTNPLFHSINILFDEADYVLSTESGTTLRTSFDDQAWLEDLRRVRGFSGVSGFLSSHRIGSTSRGDLVLSYYFPFPSYLSDVRGFVVVHLREREFSRLINDTDRSSQGSIAVIDEGGVFISHPDQGLVGAKWTNQPGLKAVLDPEHPEGIVSETPENGQLVTWFRPGPAWTYLGDFPLEALTRNVGTIRLWTIGASLALLLVGVVIAFLLAQRFFHPVRRLIRDVNRRIGRQEDWEGNELTLLSGAFDILLKRETQLFHDLESQVRRRNEEWVGRALRGECSPTTVPPGLEGQFWLAGLVVIDGYQGFTQSFLPDQREYLRSVVLHMAEQAFLPEIRCLGTVTDPRGLGLVLVTDEDDGGRFADRIDDGFEVLLSEAARVLGTSISLCLGTRGPGLDHLPQAWAEANALVHQKFLRGPGQWFWEENPAVSSGAPFFPLKTERALVAALEARDLGGVESSMDELRHTLSSRTDLSYDNVQLILHQLIGAVVRHLVENSIDLTDLFGTGSDLHRALSEFETLGDALSWIDATLQAVLNRTTEAGEGGYVPAMVRYIRTHWHRDFGVEEVADAVGLSYSHARKVFEDAMGESIVDHLNALRIEEARTLLGCSDKPLEAIAAAVGYNNGQSFHRHFKKMTGVTPGEFRARAQGTKFAESSQR